MGMAFLECRACWYTEQVVRRVDPFPTAYSEYTSKQGRVSRRPLVRKGGGRPYRHGILGPRQPKIETVAVQNGRVCR
jgi:hypothetical protein